MRPTFSIDDFSGGLNTAVAESRLRPTESPDLSNVELLESGAIKRRNGYAAIAATIGAGSAVKALYRYYQKDGDKYWMAVVATGVYTQSVTYGPSSRVECEDVVSATSGGGWFAQADPSLSAGLAYTSTTLDTYVSATFDVPSSSRITLGYGGLLSTVCATITCAVDNTGTVVLSGSSSITTYTFAGLSATSHQVWVQASYAVTVQAPKYDYIDYSTPGSWTLADGSLSATANYFGFTTLNDTCYYNTDYDTLAKFDGSTATTVTATGAPKGGFLVEHKRRLFTCGDNTDRAKLYWCDLDSPETNWANGGNIYLAGKDSGGEPTGLTVWDNKIIYMANSRMYAMDITGDDSNWSAAMSGYNALSNKLGCVAPNSLVQTNSALIFLADDGVRAYGALPGLFSTDGSGLITLSAAIRPDLAALSDSARAIAAAAFYNGRYYLSVDSDDDGVNDVTYVYRLPTDDLGPAWTKYSYGAQCWCVTRGDEYGLYFGSSDGRIHQAETGANDDGATIQFSYKTPPLAPDGYETTKNFRTLHIAAESTTTQSMTLSVATDDLSPSDQSLSVSNNSAIQPVRAQIPARGRSIQHTISGSGAGQPLTLSELTTTYTRARMK